MVFGSVIEELRQAFPCCNKRKGGQSVEIGGPADVRHVDISDSLPGLTDAQRKHIREKATSDAARLLSLHSHPPTTKTLPFVSDIPTPTPINSPHSPNPHRAGSGPATSFPEQPSSVVSSYEPRTSTTLLNAASKDESNNVPTPPRLLHKEDGQPTIRMKSMWKSDKTHNSDSSDHDEILYETLPGVKELKEKNIYGPSKTLDIEFDWENKENGSTAACELGSIGASDAQDMADSEQELSNTTSKQHT